MYRLLIAEDEPLEREGLLDAVRRLSPEIDETRVAENGRQALRVAESFAPHLAILDIKMPGIDGIEAARLLRERNGEIQIIFLTAFDQFEYARQALRLRATEFLVKPAADEEVAAAVKKAVAALRELQEAGESQEELSRAVELLTPLAQQQLMERLFLGDEHSLERIEALFGTPREASLLVVRLTPPAVDQLSPVPGRMEARLRRLHHLLDQVVRRCGYDTLPWRQGGELRLALLSVEGAGKERELSGAIENGLAEYRRREGAGVQGILTEKSSQAAELARWAAEASISLERRGTTASRLSLHSHKTGEEADRYDLERALLGELRRGNSEEVRRLGEQLLAEAEPPQMLSERLTYLAHALRVPAVPLGEELTPGRARELFLTALEELRRRNRKRGTGDLSPAVRRAREYIDHHYMEELTLESLARVASMSAYHLSRLFKRETGQTVVGYVTECRLRVARELLSDGELSVKEVSGRTGFADPSYFSRVFARREGVSPREYRRQRLTS